MGLVNSKTNQWKISKVKLGKNNGKYYGKDC